MEENKIEQDFIFLIMNCQKYREKAIVQKKTWLMELPHDKIIYYHVIGNIDLQTDFLFDNQERILWVKTLDDYNSLPHKVISAYDAINNIFKYKYIFKTDDDQQLNNCKHFLNTIIKFVESVSPKIHYGGKIVNVHAPHISQYYKIHPELPKNLYIDAIKYCNGRFYLLSNDAVEDLLNKKDKISKEYLEDYSIGYYLDYKYKKEIFLINSDTYFKDFFI